MQQQKLYLYILFLSLFVIPQVANAKFHNTVDTLRICLDLPIDEQKANELKQQLETTLNNDDIKIRWSESCVTTNDGIWITANYPVIWDEKSKWNKKLDESTIQFDVRIWRSDVMADISSFLVGNWDQTKYLIEYPATNSAVIPLLTNSVAGIGLLTINQCDKAQEHFSKAQNAAVKSDLQTKNLQATIAFYQGNCAIHQKDYIAARDYFIQSMTLPSERFGPNYAPEMNLGWTYWKLNQTEKALDVLDKDIATTTDTLRPFHILKRAEFYVILSRYDDAINDYNTAINQIPDLASTYVQRGQTYLLLYQWDNVAADYNKAIELDPTYADAYFYRGVLYYSILQTGQTMYTDALTDFQHYLELAPDGEHAAEATRYATDIQTQINALNN